MLLNDRDQTIAMTAEWTGERYPNGRPRAVSYTHLTLPTIA